MILYPWCKYTGSRRLSNGDHSTVKLSITHICPHSYETTFIQNDEIIGTEYVTENKELTIISLNVCRLNTRSVYPDFILFCK